MKRLWSRRFDWVQVTAGFNSIDYFPQDVAPTLDGIGVRHRGVHLPLQVNSMFSRSIFEL